MEMTVTGPKCPDHGSLVVELALGRLDDDLAGEAEQVLAACSTCRDWWQSRLSHEAVDEGVTRTFESFRPPARMGSRLWLVAAAVVLMVAAGLQWHSTRAPSTSMVPSPAELVDHAFQERERGIGDLTGDGVLDAADLARSLGNASATR
jgi:hypothetical protein